MPLPWIIAGVAAAAAVAGWLEADSQQDPREDEQKRSRKKLRALEARLADAEDRHRVLRAQLGRKNGQVKTLAREVARLRRKIARLEDRR